VQTGEGTNPAGWGRGQQAWPGDRRPNGS
jgi:hypothetical protein